MVVSSKALNTTIRIINKSKNKSLPSPLPSLQVNPIKTTIYSTSISRLDLIVDVFIRCVVYALIEQASKQAKLSMFSTGLYSVQIISFSTFVCRFYQLQGMRAYHGTSKHSTSSSSCGVFSSLFCSLYSSCDHQIRPATREYITLHSIPFSTEAVESRFIYFI